MVALRQEQLFEEIDILPMDLKTKIVDKILVNGKENGVKYKNYQEIKGYIASNDWSMLSG